MRLLCLKSIDSISLERKPSQKFTVTMGIYCRLRNIEEMVGCLGITFIKKGFAPSRIGSQPALRVHYLVHPVIITNGIELYDV